MTSVCFHCPSFSPKALNTLKDRPKAGPGYRKLVVPESLSLLFPTELTATSPPLTRSEEDRKICRDVLPATAKAGFPSFRSDTPKHHREPNAHTLDRASVASPKCVVRGSCFAIPERTEPPPFAKSYLDHGTVK